MNQILLFYVFTLQVAMAMANNNNYWANFKMKTGAAYLFNNMMADDQKIMHGVVPKTVFKHPCNKDHLDC